MRIREAESALRSTHILYRSIVDTDGKTAELSRNLATISSQHNENLAANNSADHASHIVELDTRKFRIAKAASDLEIESERLEQELEGLKGRLHELDIQGVEGSESAKTRREQDDPTMQVSIRSSSVFRLLIRCSLDSNSRFIAPWE